MSPFLIGGMIGFGIILVGSVLGFAIAAIGEVLGPAFVVAGWGATIVCNLWVLSIAFGEEAMCGILCIFLPFYQLYFVITRFDETRNAVLVWIIGIIMVVIGVAMSALHA